MKTTNRNNQTITLSTTPTHFEKLNEFSIAVYTLNESPIHQ
ncbi:hypothetical protein ACOYR1_06005 [Thalassotalea piscium]